MEIADDRPFPLRQRFRRRALPVLAVLLVASVALSLVGGRRLVEDVYLEVAQQRADAIARSAEREAPGAWARLMSLSGADGLPRPEALADLQAAVSRALADSRLEKLKIYDRSGRLIFNTEGTDLGQVERSAAMRALLEDLKPQIVLKNDGAVPLYELYVWWRKADGVPHLIMELYEPVAYLDSLIWRHLAVQVTVPATLVLGLILLLWRMVDHAQSDIDRRTQALAGVKDRLSRLVSGHAVGAARQALEEGRIASRAVDATLYHADVRRFTSFAEETPPERVVAFLNRIMAVQVRLVREHGGDVDKMIGDALLAVFEGPDRAARAVSCAQAVQAALAAEADLPRRLGIGLYDGFVISGVVGPEERQDFTVIGDAVNVAARLCGLAAEGEVVVDTRTLARAGHPAGFAESEDLQVKGRSEPMRVRRWRVADPVPIP